MTGEAPSRADSAATAMPITAASVGGKGTATGRAVGP
jgi:hypothetical protein